MAVLSTRRDPLAYNINGGVGRNGTRGFGFAPAGHYLIKAYFEPTGEEFAGTKAPTDLSMWQPESREVDITGDTEVALKLFRRQ